MDVYLGRRVRNRVKGMNPVAEVFDQQSRGSLAPLELIRFQTQPITWLSDQADLVLLQNLLCVG